MTLVLQASLETLACLDHKVTLAHLDRGDQSDLTESVDHLDLLDSLVRREEKETKERPVNRENLASQACQETPDQPVPQAHPDTLPVTREHSVSSGLPGEGATTALIEAAFTTSTTRLVITKLTRVSRIP